MFSVERLLVQGSKDSSFEWKKQRYLSCKASTKHHMSSVVLSFSSVVPTEKFRAFPFSSTKNMISLLLIFALLFKRLYLGLNPSGMPSEVVRSPKTSAFGFYNRATNESSLRESFHIDKNGKNEHRKTKTMIHN